MFYYRFIYHRGSDFFHYVFHYVFYYSRGFFYGRSGSSGFAGATTTGFLRGFHFASIRVVHFVEVDEFDHSRFSAITAAICMGREAHEDPARRYVAAVAAGVFYVALGLVGGAVVGLLQAFPRELVLVVAALALLGTIAGGLAVALQHEAHRDAAALTFLVTLSGVTLAGIGSAFWGVVAGSAALVVQHYRSRV